MTNRDWCQHCNGPREITDISDEVTVGHEKPYRAIHLSCGHSIATERQAF